MGTDHARCPGGACPVCNPPPVTIFEEEPPDADSQSVQALMRLSERFASTVHLSSVVGVDGRAEECAECHRPLSSGGRGCPACAATVGPPKAAPAPEDEKPGESAVNVHQAIIDEWSEVGPQGVSSIHDPIPDFDRIWDEIVEKHTRAK